MDNKLDFSERLKNKYRLIILNDDTLDEIKSYRLKLWHFFAMTIGFMLICTLLSICIIAFTPLKKYLGKYVGLESNSIFVDLNKRLIELEKEVANQEVYKTGFENLLNGVSPTDTLQEGDEESYINEEDKVRLEDVLIHSPLNGILSGAFDASKAHFGIDLTAPKDSPIKSILPGSVIQASWNSDTGHTITVMHAHNLISIYKHNSSLLKEKGEIVQAGESIAIIGNSGELSTGPHLHFEIWQNGQPIDPEKFIKLK